MSLEKLESIIKDMERTTGKKILPDGKTSRNTDTPPNFTEEDIKRASEMFGTDNPFKDLFGGFGGFK